MPKTTWISAVGESAVNFAAQKWDITPDEARRIISTAIKDEMLSPILPTSELIDFVLEIKRELDLPPILPKQPIPRGYVDPLDEKSVAFAAAVWKMPKDKAFKLIENRNFEIQPQITFTEFIFSVKRELEEKPIPKLPPHNAVEISPLVTTPQRPRRSKKDTEFRAAVSPAIHPAWNPLLRFSWLFIFIACAVILAPVLLLPDYDFVFAILAAFVFSAYSLYHVYTGTLRTNGRAGCLLWMMFLGSIYLCVMGGVSFFVKPDSDSPPAIVAQANTPRPKPTSTTAARAVTKVNCLHWSQVNAKMKGQSACVYGYVNDHFENFQVQASYFYFGTHDQFFLVSSYRWRENLEKTCISANGTVELNSYGVPYIKVADRLLTCP